MAIARKTQGIQTIHEVGALYPKGNPKKWHLDTHNTHKNNNKN